MAVPPYCTNADVQAMEPALTLGVGKNPTTANVDTYIQLTQADVDLVLLRAGIDAPVDFTLMTAPVARAVLRRINAQGALAMTVAAAPSFPADRRKQIATEYETAIKGLSDLVPRLDLPTDPLDTAPRGSGSMTATTVEYPPSAPYASPGGPQAAADLPMRDPYFFRGQRF